MIALKRTKNLAIGFAIVFGLIWLAAAVTFARATPLVESKLPELSPHPAGTHNLVAHEYGPKIVASSCFWSALHHPAYLVDNHATPSFLEKWVSETDDSSPWIELSWDRARTINSVQIVHAGAFEHPAYTASDYVIHCLPAGQPSLQVRNNRQARVNHALACPSATGIRVEFTLNPRNGQDLVRLYELQVTGQ